MGKIDIPCSSLTNNEQSSSISITLRKQNSYQVVNRHQIVLPTIVESNDHEMMIDDVSNMSDVEHNKYVVQRKPEDSFVATNTNYNQVKNIHLERKERTLNANKNSEIPEFTIDKRINELIQQQNRRQTKVRDIMLIFAASNCQ